MTVLSALPEASRWPVMSKARLVMVLECPNASMLSISSKGLLFFTSHSVMIGSTRGLESSLSILAEAMARMFPFGEKASALMPSTVPMEV